MMPICQEPHCKKISTEEVGKVVDSEIGGYNPIYMCENMPKNFIKNMEVKDERAKL